MLIARGSFTILAGGEVRAWIAGDASAHSTDVAPSGADFARFAARRHDGLPSRTVVPVPPGVRSVTRRGGDRATAGRDRSSARQQAGDRLLGLLWLPAGRTQRAPGGAHHDPGAGAHGESLPGATAGRPAEPVSPFPPGVAPAARWAPAKRPRARGRPAARWRRPPPVSWCGSKPVAGSSVCYGCWRADPEAPSGAHDDARAEARGDHGSRLARKRRSPNDRHAECCKCTFEVGARPAPGPCARRQTDRRLLDLLRLRAADSDVRQTARMTMPAFAWRSAREAAPASPIAARGPVPGRQAEHLARRPGDRGPRAAIGVAAPREATPLVACSLPLVIGTNLHRRRDACDRGPRASSRAALAATLLGAWSGCWR